MIGPHVKAGEVLALATAQGAVGRRRPRPGFATSESAPTRSCRLCGTTTEPSAITTQSATASTRRRTPWSAPIGHRHDQQRDQRGPRLGVGNAHHTGHGDGRGEGACGRARCAPGQVEGEHRRGGQDLAEGVGVQRAGAAHGVARREHRGKAPVGRPVALRDLLDDGHERQQADARHDGPHGAPQPRRRVQDHHQHGHDRAVAEQVERLRRRGAAVAGKQRSRRIRKRERGEGQELTGEAEVLAARGPAQHHAGQEDGDQGMRGAPAGQHVGHVGHQQEEDGHEAPADLRDGGRDGKSPRPARRTRCRGSDAWPRAVPTANAAAATAIRPAQSAMPAPDTRGGACRPRPASCTSVVVLGPNRLPTRLHGFWSGGAL